MGNWQGEKNSGKGWTRPEVQKLKALAKDNTPTRVIAGLLGRSAAGVSSKAAALKVYLRPPNRSPYNRRKGK
jgi:hypothetical protein